MSDSIWKRCTFKLSLQYQDIIQQIGDEKWQNLYQLVDATYSLYYMYRLHRNAMQKFLYKARKKTEKYENEKNLFAFE